MPRMGWLAFIAACAGAGSLALPWPGMFVAMGLGIAAIGTGLTGWRRRADPGPARLAGAGAITIGAAALLLASLKYGLTLVAIGKIEALL
jgi:hypothetical protein